MSTRSFTTRVAREPLTHFGLAGLGLFALYALVAIPADDSHSDTIVVDRGALLAYMQYRSNAFREEYFGKQLDELRADERAALAADYVRDEALYREALSLDLAAGDYVIRQRLIQRMQYLLEDVAAPAQPPDETAIAKYFEEHALDYADGPSLTFTHLFFATAEHGETAARELATRSLPELNRSGAGHEPTIGDRFPYFRSYVERTPDYVASHFGSSFAAALETLTPATGLWQGPLLSSHGAHLVLLTQRSPSRVPSLDEVRGRVEEDLHRARLAAAREAAVAALVGRYIAIRADDTPTSPREN